MKTKIVFVAMLALFTAGQAQASGRGHKKNKVEMCHKGNTIMVSGHSAEKHLRHGDSIGSCAMCDPLIDSDGTVVICKDGETKHMKPNKACREVAKGKVEFGFCDESDSVGSDDSDGGSDSDGSDDSTDDGSDDDDDDSNAFVDTDADGVYDSADACPNTVSGDPADASGCSCTQRGDCDADGDGVFDQDDLCPNTVGDPVDASGCSCTQRGDCDADGDGVYDQDDACPSTPTGDIVYADGCTVVTISAFAGPDMSALPGDTVNVVGQGSVLTGGYDSANLVYTWEQVGGTPVWFQFSSPPLAVDMTGSGATATFMLTVSTADGSATATDQFTINVNTAAIIVASANCDPVTGHCYALAKLPNGANDNLPWDDAKAKANNMYFNGMRGHLATVTSIEERRDIAGTARNAVAFLAGTDRVTEGVWMWADGPEAGQPIQYLPWALNEPSNSYNWRWPEGEDYLVHEARGENDGPGSGWYYVEFEAGW